MENSEILGLPELATETTLLAVHMKNASYTYPSRAFRAWGLLLKNLCFSDSIPPYFRGGPELGRKVRSASLRKEVDVGRPVNFPTAFWACSSEKQDVPCAV